MTGSVREINRLMIPLAAVGAASVVNTMADRLFLSWHSDAALQAVVPAVSLAGSLTCFFTTTVGYVSAFVGRAAGRGDLRGVRSALAQALVLAGCFLPFFAVLHPAGAAFIRASGHAPETVNAEVAALAWLLPSNAVRMFAAAFAGYFTGTGRTRVVGVAGVAGAVVNIALDPLLIFGAGYVPAMGVAGSAAATLSASCTTTAFLAFAAYRDFRSNPVPGAMRPAGAEMWNLLRLGAPHGAMSLFCGSAFAVFVMAAGRLGPVALAASNVAFGFNGIYFTAVCAIREVCTAVVAHFKGRNDADAMRGTVRASLLLSWIYALAFSVSALLAAWFVADFFIGGDSSIEQPEFSKVLFALFVVMCTRSFAEGFSETYAAALRGVGETAYILGVRIVCVLFVWMPLLALVLGSSGSIACCWTTMTAYLLASGLLLRKRWQKCVSA